MQNIEDLQAALAAWPGDYHFSSEDAAFIVQGGHAETFARMVDKRLAEVFAAAEKDEQQIAGLEQKQYDTSIELDERLKIFDRIRDLQLKKLSSLDVHWFIEFLRDEAPEALLAFSPETTKILFSYLYSNYDGRIISDNDLVYFYGFFNRRLRRGKKYQKIARAHCEVLQSTIAELQTEDQRPKSRGMFGASRSITSIFSDMPAALAKIGPDSSELKNVGNTNMADLEDFNVRRLFNFIIRQARIIAEQGEENLDQRLDNYFRPFNVAARIITSRQSCHPSDVVLIAVQGKGVYLSIKEKYKATKPFTQMLDEMIKNEQFERVYRSGIIPRLVTIIYNLKNDPMFAGTLGDAEKAMEEKLGRSNDTRLQRAYYRHYKPVIPSR